jgi:hypothetical protein
LLAVAKRRVEYYDSVAFHIFPVSRDFSRVFVIFAMPQNKNPTAIIWQWGVKSLCSSLQPNRHSAKQQSFFGN